MRTINHFDILFAVTIVLIAQIKTEKTSILDHLNLFTKEMFWNSLVFCK